jgi:ribonuclease HI
MRGRLRARLAFWLKFCTSSVILGWVTDGFPIYWIDGRAPAPREFPNHSTAFEQAGFVDRQIADLLATDTIVPWDTAPTVVSPLGVVPKKGADGWRLILDLRYVNSFVVCPAFKYEGLGTLRDVLRPGDVMFTVDLKSGYHHVDMHPDSVPFLGFRWRGRYYCYTQLSFGLNVACWAFTKLVKQLARKWRSAGHRCAVYIDDSLHAGRDREALLNARSMVLSDLDHAGFIVNAKSDLTPATAKLFLGFIVDTVRGALIVPPDKREALARKLLALQATARRCHVRSLASAAGTIQSMHWAVGPLAYLLTKEMQAVITAATSYDHHVHLPAKCVAEIDFWLRCFDDYNGSRALWPPTDVRVVIHTDAAGQSSASLGGWAGFVDQGSDGHAVAHGAFGPAEAALSSTWQETYAADKALRSFNRDGRLDGHAVLIRTDSRNVYHGITKFNSRSPPVRALLLDLFFYCFRRGITLFATWVPRTLNVWADWYSHIQERDSSDWKLNSRFFQSLSARWGPFDVDLFASFANHQVPRYYSLHYTPDCAGVNAFAHRWGRRCWCNPPFCLIGRVWRHALSCRARLSLVVPYWPSAPWWPTIAQGGVFSPAVRDVVILPPAHEVDAFLADPALAAHGGVRALAGSFLQSATSGRAAGTVDNYAGPWRRFCSWLDALRLHGVRPLACPPALVALFLQAERERCAAAGFGPGPVKTASAAIYHHYWRAGLRPPTEHPACQVARAVAERTLVARPRARDGVDAADIRRLVAHFIHPACDLRDRMHVTCLVLAYAGFLRYDDLAKVLVHEDLLRFTATHMEIFIFSSKTDQQFAGSWVVVAREPGSPYCPVRLVEDLLAAGGYVSCPERAPGQDLGPLLRAVGRRRARDGSRRLQRVTRPLSDPIPAVSDGLLRDRAKALCAAAGVTKEVGLHSFRIGGASVAADSGVDERLVMSHGRWRSVSAARGYQRASMAGRLRVSRSLGLGA